MAKTVLLLFIGVLIGYSVSNKKSIIQKFHLKNAIFYQIISHRVKTLLNLKEKKTFTVFGQQAATSSVALSAQLVYNDTLTWLDGLEKSIMEYGKKHVNRTEVIVQGIIKDMKNLTDGLTAEADNYEQLYLAHVSFFHIKRKFLVISEFMFFFIFRSKNYTPKTKLQLRTRKLTRVFALKV